MKSQRTIISLGFAFALAALGCQDETTGPESPSVAEQGLEDGSEAAVDATEAGEDRHEGRRHRKGHHRKGFHGPDHLLRASLAELDLSDDQRAVIEDSIEELRAGFAPKAHAERGKALAEAVRSGSVNAESFADDEGMKAHRARLVEALDTLHRTLTPEQRTELVSKLKGRMAEMDRAAENRKGPPRGARKGHGKSPAHFVLHGIDISDEQRAKIDAALAGAGLDEKPSVDFEAMKEKRSAMLDAFAGASFSAEALLPTAPPEHLRGHFADTLAVIVPLLDDAQRAELADRIERGPRGFGGKHHGPEGRRGRR